MIDQRRKYSLIGHKAEISNALFNFDGSLIVTSSMDNTCRLWDSRNGECIATLRYYIILVLALLH